MAGPRISTVIAAGLSSAVGFTIITRSGLAGTLAGAAVASMVITGATHGLVHAFDGLAAWWQKRRAGEVTAPDEVTSGSVPAAAAPESWADGAPIAAEDTPVTVVPRRPRWQRRGLIAAPYALAALALGVSAFTLVSGTPIERVIVRERVVQPGTTVISVVTVTVPVTVTGGAAGTPTTAPGSPATSATTGLSPTTTPPPGSSTTTTVAPPTTATTQPATTTTVAAPAAP